MNRHERRRARAKGQRRHHPHILFAQEGIDPAFLEAALRNSEEIDAVSIGDREWFLANPGRTFRLRETAEAEVGVNLRCRPEEGSGRLAYTLVCQVKPGVRSRISFTAPPYCQPENFSDNACAMLLAEIEQQQPQVTEVIEALASIGGRS